MIEQVDKILKQIEIARKKKGLTYGNMLTEVTVQSASAYSKIEKSRKISVLRLLEISRALEVDVTTWFEDLEDKRNMIKEDQEKYGKQSERDLNDVYLLVHELKREILSLKKEIAGMKAPAVKKRKSSKTN